MWPWVIVASLPGKSWGSPKVGTTWTLRIDWELYLRASACPRVWGKYLIKSSNTWVKDRPVAFLPTRNRTSSQGSSTNPFHTLTDIFAFCHPSTSQSVQKGPSSLYWTHRDSARISWIVPILQMCLIHYLRYSVLLEKKISNINKKKK